MNYDDILRESAADSFGGMLDEEVHEIYMEHFGDWVRSGYIHGEVAKRIKDAMSQAYELGRDAAHF